MNIIDYNHWRRVLNVNKTRMEGTEVITETSEINHHSPSWSVSESSVSVPITALLGGSWPLTDFLLALSFTGIFFFEVPASWSLEAPFLLFDDPAAMSFDADFYESIYRLVHIPCISSRNFKMVDRYRWVFHMVMWRWVFHTVTCLITSMTFSQTSSKGTSWHPPHLI